MAFPQVGVEAVVKNLNGYLADLGKVNSANQKAGDSSGKAAGLLGKLGGALGTVGKIAATATVVGVGAAAAAIAGIGTLSVRAAIQFESSWAGVVKTTDVDAGFLACLNMLKGNN